MMSGRVVGQLGVEVGIGALDRQLGHRAQLERGFEALRLRAAAVDGDPGDAVERGRVHLDAGPVDVEHIEVEAQHAVEQLRAQADLDILGRVGAVLQFPRQGADQLGVVDVVAIRIVRQRLGARRDAVWAADAIALAVGRIQHQVGREVVEVLNFRTQPSLLRAAAGGRKIVGARSSDRIETVQQSAGSPRRRFSSV